MGQTSKRPSWLKDWVTKNLTWKRVLGTVVGLLLIVFRDEVIKGIESFFSAITSKSGRAALSRFWRALGHSIQLPVWMLILVAVVATGASVCIGIFFRIHGRDVRERSRLASDVAAQTEKISDLELDMTKREEEAQTAQRKANNAKDLLLGTIRELDKLGKTFLESAYSLAKSDIPDEEIARLLQYVIRGVAATYNGKVDSGAILVTTEDDHEHLNWLAGYNFTLGLPDQDYYIGPATHTKHSVAGAAWLACEAQTCVVNAADGTGSHPDYIPSKRYEPGNYPYRSFISIPIAEDYFGWPHKRGEQRKLGIVCLNSPFPDTFVNDPALSREGRPTAPSMPFFHAMFRILEWRA